MTKQKPRFEDIDDYESDLEDKLIEAGREIPFKETTELGEVFNNLDSDEINKTTNSSKIDFNSRLNVNEVNCCLVFDELKSLGILPIESRLTIQKKRLSVSLGGQGRKEKVIIASGKRDSELDGGRGFFSKLLQRRE